MNDETLALVERLNDFANANFAHASELWEHHKAAVQVAESTSEQLHHLARCGECSGQVTAMTQLVKFLTEELRSSC